MTKLQTSTQNSDIHKVIKDYEDLFLENRKGHLAKYVYTGNIDYFNLLISKNQNYYIPSLESEIIKKNINSISLLLGNHLNLIEIGPGPKYSLDIKIVPLIKGLCNPSSYTSIDMNISYAAHASQIIQDSFPNINVNARQADCEQAYQLNCDNKRCILFLGCTLSNFDDNAINNIFNNFYNTLHKNELCVFSIDCNKNITELKKAYDSFFDEKLTFNIMSYFKDTFKIDDFDSQKFKFKYEWESTEQEVRFNLVSTVEQNFVFNGKNIYIPKGKKYHVAISRKYSEEFIDGIVTKHGFKIKGKFTDDGRRVFLYVLQK